MCGRFTITKDASLIVKRYQTAFVAIEEFKPSYNIPPSAKVPLVIATPKERRLETGVWGIHRDWAPNIINLKAEKLVAGPFKKLLATKRCIVPVDGFYEWGTANGRKVPSYFHLKDHELFSFPAIWDEDNPKTFAIFTTTPNSLVSPVHHRMPAILAPEDEAAWLDPMQTSQEIACALLRPYPERDMVAFPVTPAVNSPKNDVPELIRPLKPE